MRLLPPDDIEDYYVDIASSQRGTTPRVQTLRTRTNLPRMKKLMEWALLKPGDLVEIVNHGDSDAEVVDHKTVRHKGQVMSFNEWGAKVTGWSAICIYEWAKTKSASKTLAELRKEKMDEIESQQEDSNDA